MIRLHLRGLTLVAIVDGLMESLGNPGQVMNGLTVHGVFRCALWLGHCDIGSGHPELITHYSGSPIHNEKG
ncbi:hypothetical protein CCP4SC76_2170004 [Gammaproteobacteria bacterium]